MNANFGSNKWTTYQQQAAKEGVKVHIHARPSKEAEHAASVDASAESHPEVEKVQSSFGRKMIKGLLAAGFVSVVAVTMTMVSKTSESEAQMRADYVQQVAAAHNNELNGNYPAAAIIDHGIGNAILLQNSLQALGLKPCKVAYNGYIACDKEEGGPVPTFRTGQSLAHAELGRVLEMGKTSGAIDAGIYLTERGGYGVTVMKEPAMPGVQPQEGRQAIFVENSLLSSIRTHHTNQTGEQSNILNFLLVQKAAEALHVKQGQSPEEATRNADREAVEFLRSKGMSDDAISSVKNSALLEISYAALRGMPSTPGWDQVKSTAALAKDMAVRSYSLRSYINDTKKHSVFERG